MTGGSLQQRLLQPECRVEDLGDVGQMRRFLGPGRRRDHHALVAQLQRGIERALVGAEERRRGFGSGLCHSPLAGRSNRRYSAPSRRADASGRGR